MDNINESKTKKNRDDHLLLNENYRKVLRIWLKGMENRKCIGATCDVIAKL